MNKVNRVLGFILILSFQFLFDRTNVAAQEISSKDYLKKYEAKIERVEWFTDARFGMFIHFGPYAIPARGEWVKSNERMTNEQYQKYVDAFSPSKYDPNNWALLAKNAGMKYAVMTAKHHDGFCMYNSKYTNYKISKNMPNRDFIKEYVEAFRAQGLKVGLYYSLIDWHHADYPNVGNHPMRDNKDWDNTGKDWNRYLEYMHNQIEELMTQYGKIDVLWLDFSFDNYSGEKWKAKELVKMIRKHQPNILLNSRLLVNEGNSAKARNIDEYGDFETPEMGIPEVPLQDVYGNPVIWETCLTLNNSWGYSSFDNEWKSAELVIHSLTEVVSKNGNLLLNVGPDAQGVIPNSCAQVLKEVGEWLQHSGESIYGCSKASIAKPLWGYYTQKGDITYAHWTNPKIGYINIKEFTERQLEVTVLKTQKPAVTATKWWGNEDSGNFFINVKKPIYHTFKLPDNKNTVFKIEEEDTETNIEN